MRRAGCPFCRSPRADHWLLIGEHGALLADHRPAMVGHALAIPPDHVPSVADLSDLPSKAFSGFVRRAMLHATECLKTPVVALEHGRSPICLGPGECHAHVHLFPLPIDLETLASIPLIEAVDEPGEGEYLAFQQSHCTPAHFFRPRSPTRHLVRSVLAISCERLGVTGWLPLLAPQSHSHRHLSSTLARMRLGPQGSKRRTKTVYISGLAGVGKSSLGRAIAESTKREALEVGVLVRLLALHSRPVGHGSADLLWRWFKNRRLQFDAPSKLGLAAAIPRLDGRTTEQELWTHPAAARLAELASSPAVNDVLDAIIQRASSSGMQLVIGRKPVGSASAAAEVELIAEAEIRRLRKLRQLATLGIAPEQSLYDPPSLAVRTRSSAPDYVIDTSRTSPAEIGRLATDWLVSIGVLQAERTDAAA